MTTGRKMRKIKSINLDDISTWFWVLIIIISIILSSFFTKFGEDLYQSIRNWVTSQFGTPKLTNATLRQQTITLYEDIMGFLGEREANEPSIDFNNWEESTNNISRHYQETMNLYHENFGTRVVEIREEYLKRGITNEKVEMFYTHPTNPIGIHELAYGLAELASKIEP